MSTRMASDEVTDGIAAIEMHRQGTEQESGLAVSCTEALRKLQTLLEEEKAALQLHGPESVHAINVEVVVNEIRRVQSMTGAKGKGQKQRNPHHRAAPQAPRPDRPRGNAGRNRGRRSLGRGGGRGGRGNRGGEGSGGGGGGGGPGPGQGPRQ